MQNMRIIKRPLPSHQKGAFLCTLILPLLLARLYPFNPQMCLNGLDGNFLPMEQSTYPLEIFTHILPDKTQDCGKIV